jgi:hypothetical protein
MKIQMMLSTIFICFFFVEGFERKENRKIDKRLVSFLMVSAGKMCLTEGGKLIA